MIKVSALYPYSKNARFDMEYYLGKHIPLCVKLFSAHPGYGGVSVERGLIGTAPAVEPPFLILAHFFFTSVESFESAFAGNGPTLNGDIPNFTDIVPRLQISEVLMSA